jgi:hypothetical protein
VQGSATLANAVARKGKVLDTLSSNVGGAQDHQAAEAQAVHAPQYASHCTPDNAHGRLFDTEQSSAQDQGTQQQEKQHESAVAAGGHEASRMDAKRPQPLDCEHGMLFC